MDSAAPSRFFSLSRSGRAGGRGSASRSAAAVPSSARRRHRQSPQQNNSNVNNNHNNQQREPVSTIGRRRGLVDLESPSPPQSRAPASAGARGRRERAIVAPSRAVSELVRAENRAASASVAEVSPPSAPPPPSPPSSEAASEQAMRLLKRMKPNELREISKAATALEKSKLEDCKKVRVRAVCVYVCMCVCSFS